MWVQELIARDMPGYAIGGLAGGEDKSHFVRVVSQVTYVTRASITHISHVSRISLQSLVPLHQGRVTGDICVLRGLVMLVILVITV